MSKTKEYIVLKNCIIKIKSIISCSYYETEKSDYILRIVVGGREDIDVNIVRYSSLNGVLGDYNYIIAQLESKCKVVKIKKELE